MTPNPTKKSRKPNRLKGYDYSKAGYYFVTICTKDREYFFGEIIDEKMILNDEGKIVKNQWLWLARQYNYILLDEFIVMPNHIHGILAIDDGSYNSKDKSRLVLTGTVEKIKSLSELIGAFKTTSSKMIHKIGEVDFKWQRSFYDHIIRDEKALLNIQNYIIDNPLKWNLDKNNLLNN